MQEKYFYHLTAVITRLIHCLEYFVLFLLLPLTFLSSTLSITGSMYSSTSLNKMGKPYLMANSSCFRKSGSLKVTTYKIKQQEMTIKLVMAFTSKRYEIKNYSYNFQKLPNRW